MKICLSWLLPLLFLAFGARGVSPPEKFATVTLDVVDPFGHQQTGCSVMRFARTDRDEEGDYTARFDGLIGKNIPFGNEYATFVRCSGQGTAGFVHASVRRPDQYMVVVVSAQRGDNVTGEVPRLAVSIRGDLKSRISGTTWVEVIGIYVDTREIDRTDPETGPARFYGLGIGPGRYIVLVHTGDKLVCTQQIDILGPEARVGFLLSQLGCSAEAASSVRLIPTDER